MKKILLAGTAIVGLAALATPAHAELKLNLGGYFSGYGVYADNNEAAGAANSLHTFDLRRDTELHVNGESTLDNGLTVGFHTEQSLGNSFQGNPAGNVAGLGGTQTDEVYAYFSGGWGRGNLGSEDGAAYLLQVAAPSADSNIDGLRTYIQALNPRDGAFAAGGGVPGLANNGVLDYDQVSDPTGAPDTDRITYLTPKFDGFQAGVSYAPLAGQNGLGSTFNGPRAPMTGSNVPGAYDNIWEGSARWDGEFQGVGIALGGGYSDASLQANGTAPATVLTAPTVSDGLQQWNGGVNLSWSGFSLGGSYLRGTTKDQDLYDADGGGAGAPALVNMNVVQQTYVGGLGWDNGPYHLGGSYLRQETTRDASGVNTTALFGATTKTDLVADRWTVGGGYTYGPGMTFRGALAWGKFDNSTAAPTGAQLGNLTGSAATNNRFTQATVGTEIDF